MIVGFRKFLDWIGLASRENIFYIGGADVLPPPLKGQEEQTALEALEQGSEEAKQLAEYLTEYNCVKIK